MDIIVKQDFSANDAKKADLKRAQHRLTGSRVDGVLNAADTKTTVLLCDDHVRAFAQPSVLRKYGYRQFTEYPYVLGNCDYCQVHGRCQVFTHESIFKDVWKTKEDRRADLLNATIVR